MRKWYFFFMLKVGRLIWTPMNLGIDILVNIITLRTVYYYFYTNNSMAIKNMAYMVVSGYHSLRTSTVSETL